LQEIEFSSSHDQECETKEKNMNVIVNNNSQFIKEESSVLEMAGQLEIESKGIAIAINQTVISKSDWSTIQLKENDNITIIKATQGG